MLSKNLVHDPLVEEACGLSVAAAKPAEPRCRYVTFALSDIEVEFLRQFGRLESVKSTLLTAGCAGYKGLREPINLTNVPWNNEQLSVLQRFPLLLCIANSLAFAGHELAQPAVAPG